MYKIFRYVTMLSLISFTLIPICKAMNINIIPTDTINRTSVAIDNIIIAKLSTYTTDNFFKLKLSDILFTFILGETQKFKSLKLTSKVNHTC